MIVEPPISLPLFDRRLLRAVEGLVPAAERADWSRAWQSELWHMRQRTNQGGIQGFMVVFDLSIGVTRDALWLRTESWRRSYSGTPGLCLCSMLLLCLVYAGVGLAFEGSWHLFWLYVDRSFDRSLIAAPLVVFVVFATASSRHIEQGSTSRRLFWINRQLFFAVKSAEVLALAFLVSADLCQPIRSALPNTADVCQIFSFVVVALVGLQWALRDQEQRCKHCLHSLATPARVGRPSRNLLEWNGTELSCKQGHGLLSVPELETSWCQSSRWISLIGG